jgi:predicted Zn finger-like uncharacterized protein
VKFSCNKCDTKYSIADEKVRGKVLKIRCKKCENIIVLREPKEEAQPRGEEATRAVTLDPGMLASLRESLPAQGPAQSALPSAQPGAIRQPPQRMQTGTNIPVARAPSQPVAPLRVQANQALAPQVRQALPPVEEWYLAIKGQQVGPMALQDVQTRIAHGEADERTYGWRDGMGDWKRLADIPEFKGFVGRTQPPPPPVAPPPPVEDQGGGAQVVDLQAEIARRKRAPQPTEDFQLTQSEAMSIAVPVRQPTNVGRAQEPAARAQPESLANVFDDPSSEGSAPLGGASLSGGAADPFGAVPDAHGATDGPPRESTRMFIAAAGLANRGRNHKVYAAVGAVLFSAVAGVLYLDASGIYQIPIVSDIVSVGFAALDVEQPKARSQRVVEDDGSGSDLSFLGIGKPKVKKVARKTGGGTPGMPDLDVGGTDLKDALAGATNNQGGNTFERKGESAAGIEEPTSNKDQSQALKSLLAVDGRKGVAVNDPAAGKGSVEVKELVKKAEHVDTPLTPEQIGKVVIDSKTTLTQCANDAAKVNEKYKGTVKALVVIGPSGKVKKVTINDTKVPERFKECIARSLMRWMFPSFKGEEFEAELPLKLSVGS